MPRNIIQDKCNGCGVCFDACPVEAIVKTENKYSIIKEECVDCGTCKRICKEEAVEGNDPIHAGRR